MVIRNGTPVPDYETDAATWLRGHPAVSDRRKMGWGVVRVVRITECGWTGETVQS